VPVQRFAERVGDHAAGRPEGNFGHLFHAAREVVVLRSVGHAAVRQQLCPSSRGVPLVPQQPRPV